jgi:hypothetical protein
MSNNRSFSNSWFGPGMIAVVAALGSFVMGLPHYSWVYGAMFLLGTLALIIVPGLISRLIRR